MALGDLAGPQWGPRLLVFSATARRAGRARRSRPGGLAGRGFTWQGITGLAAAQQHPGELALGVEQLVEGGRHMVIGDPDGRGGGWVRPGRGPQPRCRSRPRTRAALLCG